MIIFNPVTFKRFTAINRLVKSAACEYMSDEVGKPTAIMVELYDELRNSEIGIIISGYAYVLPNGKSTNGQAGIYSDELIPFWKPVTETIRKGKSLFLCQIVHGGRQVRAKVNPGPVWSSSAVNDSVYKTEPKAMNIEEIEMVIRAFIDAAKRCKQAGFHGIQLHAAHGYLLSQFMSPYTNIRTDEYGGNQEKRSRIIINIIKGIRKEIKGKFIVSAKVNCEDFREDGLKLEQSLETIKLMEEAGLDFVEISGGMSESTIPTIRQNINSLIDEGYFRKQAAFIKKNISIPLAVAGGFRTLAFMDQVLRSGEADFISLCRPFIREPDLVKKFKEAAIKSKCISCNKCFSPRGLRCSERENK